MGEKQILGDSFDAVKYSKWLELSGIFTLDSNGMNGELMPFIQQLGR